VELLQEYQEGVNDWLGFAASLMADPVALASIEATKPKLAAYIRKLAIKNN